MRVAHTLDRLHDVTDEMKSLTSQMTDKQLSRALALNETIGLHLHFEALLRIREAQRNDQSPYPFPVAYGD